jgi:hypothetical protein
MTINNSLSYDGRWDTTGIKDWITQVNSGHRDRMSQPKNVVLAKP